MSEFRTITAKYYTSKIQGEGNFLRRCEDQEEIVTNNDHQKCAREECTNKTYFNILSQKSDMYCEAHQGIHIKDKYIKEYSDVYERLLDSSNYRKYKSLFEASLSCSHEDVSEIIYRALQDYCVIDGSTVWKWDTKTKLWHRSKKADLISLVFDIVTPLYIILELEHMHNFIDDKGADHEILIKKLEILIRKLSTVGYVQNVLTATCPLLKVDGFTLKLDSSCDLIPLKNGQVVNVKTKEIRERKSTDYFTKEIDREIARKIFQELMLDSTTEYKESQDPFTRFFTERVTINNEVDVKFKANGIKSSELYEEYSQWCFIEEINPVTPTKFGLEAQRVTGCNRQNKLLKKFNDGWYYMGCRYNQITQ